jgi:hypothetical protein
LGLAVGLSVRQYAAARFPFAAPTPAAVFRRADTVWLVFDTAGKVNLTPRSRAGRQRHPQREIPTGRRRRSHRASSEPASSSARRRGPLGHLHRRPPVTIPTQPLSVRAPCSASPHQSGDPFERSKLHFLRDPDIGDRLMVRRSARRGFLKQQDFIEDAGVDPRRGGAPIADDLTAELETNRIISRPNGRRCRRPPARRAASAFHSLTFDPQTWA